MTQYNSHRRGYRWAPVLASILLAGALLCAGAPVWAQEIDGPIGPQPDPGPIIDPFPPSPTPLPPIPPPDKLPCTTESCGPDVPTRPMIVVRPATPACATRQNGVPQRCEGDERSRQSGSEKH